MSDQDRVNLRAVLISTESPYPRMRRPISLEQAVHTAHQLWEEGNGDESPSLYRLAEAARALPHEVIEKTLTLGSSVARWSSGFFGSAAGAFVAATSAGTTASSPAATAAAGSLPSKAEAAAIGDDNSDQRDGGDLRNSLRIRGGVHVSSSRPHGSPAASGAAGGATVGAAVDARVAMAAVSQEAAPSATVTPRAKSACCGGV